MILIMLACKRSALSKAGTKGKVNGCLHKAEIINLP